VIEEVTLPKWGMTMQDGTITEWMVEVGEAVSEGDTIAIVATEKAEAELEAPASGRLVEVLVPDGETVEVGTVVARIDTG